MAGRVSWVRWALKRKQVTVTTWKLRLSVLVTAVLLLCLCYPAWLVGIGDSLVHQERLEPADLILLENFHPDPLVFEAAQDLVRSGYSLQVLVPVRASAELEVDPVQRGFVEVMSRAAGIERYEILPVRHIEPIISA